MVSQLSLVLFESLTELVERQSDFSDSAILNLSRLVLEDGQDWGSRLDEIELSESLEKILFFLFIVSAETQHNVGSQGHEVNIAISALVYVLDELHRNVNFAQKTARLFSVAADHKFHLLDAQLLELLANLWYHAFLQSFGIDNGSHWRFPSGQISDNRKVAFDVPHRFTTFNWDDSEVLLGCGLQVLVEGILLLVHLVIHLKYVFLIVEIHEELNVHLAHDEV